LPSFMNVRPRASCSSRRRSTTQSTLASKKVRAEAQENGYEDSQRF
jgi:hypothetical protein